MTSKTIQANIDDDVIYKVIKYGYETVVNTIHITSDMPTEITYNLEPSSTIYNSQLNYSVNTNVDGSPIITTQSFTLPDNEICEEKRYCYAPVGNNYNYVIDGLVKHPNVITIGSPIITEDGITSNFSSTDYLKLPEVFPSFTTCEILLKAMRSDDTQFGSLIARGDTSVGAAGVDSSNGAFGKNNGSSWTSGNTFIELNKYYWYKIIASGNNFSGYLLEDNGYTNNTLPNIENWSLEWSNSGDTFTGQQCIIGNSLVNSTEFWKGSIDLFQCYIKINGQLWWIPYYTTEEKITQSIPGILDDSIITDNWEQNQTYNLYQLKNQDNTNSLLLTNNIITNNTQKYSQYVDQILIPARDYKWYYNNNTWMANKSIYKYNTMTNASDVLDFKDSYIGVSQNEYHKYTNPEVCLMDINGGQTITRYSANGTMLGNISFNDNTGVLSNFYEDSYLELQQSFNPGSSTWEMVSKININVLGKYQFWYYRPLAVGLDSSNRMHIWNLPNGTDVYSTFTFSSGIDYWVKLEFTGTEYIGSYKTSSDGQWINILSYTSSDFIVPTESNVLIGINPNLISEYFYGSIDLTQCQIKINNQTWWNGTTIITENNKYVISTKEDVDYGNFNNLPNTLIDNYNFIISNNKITNGPSSYNVNNGLSFGYFTITPNNNSIAKIAAYISSEGGYDYGACYVGTQLYNANRSQIIGQTSDGYGSWIFSISGSTSSSVYNVNLEAGKTYYVHFYYTKDSSAHGGDDRLYVTNLDGFIDTTTKTKVVNGCLYNYNDDGSQHDFDVYYDSSYTQPILISSGINYTNGTKVDTITIPAHSTWSYNNGEWIQINS